jgi:AcrR family transcriptional regulator
MNECSTLTTECPFDTLNANSETHIERSGDADMKAGERREREIAHARTDILEAAMRAFAQAGLHNTTMQDIAREAGYTAASLYTYFKSKQEIVDAMFTQLTDEYVQVFEQPLPQGLNFRQRFEMVLHRHLELVEKRRNVFTTFIDEEACGQMCSADAHGTHGGSFHSNFERRIERLAQWFSANATSEDLGGYEPTLVARLLFGMAFGLFHQWGASTEKISFIDQAPILTEFFFHGLSGKPKTGARKK